MSVLVRAPLFLNLLLAAPVSAALLTGQFIAPQNEQTGVGVAGGVFLIDGESYPVPAVLTPTGSFTFRLTPSHRFLFSTRTSGTSACPSSATQVLFHRLPPAPGDPLIEIRDDVCVPGGIAFRLFYDRPLSSPLAIAILGGISNGSAPQSVVWVDLESGVDSTSQHSRSIESINLRVAPSGNAAFVKHGLASPPGDVDWSLVDLCPATLGTPLAFWEEITAQATAALIATGPSSYAARVVDGQFPGGSTEVPLVDCLGPPPPPPPGRHVLRIELEGNGGGAVASTPAGISCGADCDELFDQGAVVTLQATWSPDTLFEGWDGDCSGSAATTDVTISADRTCEATFTRLASNLAIDLGGVVSPVLAGSPIVFEAALSNSGPHDALAPTVSLPLPAGLTYDPVPTTAGCFLATGNRVHCLLADLPAGNQVLVSIGAIVDSLWRLPITATATVSSSTFDPILANNSATTSFSVTALVDLAISKSDTPDPAAADGTLVYQLEVANLGLSSALGIEVEDPLPAGFAPIGLPGGGPVVCPVGALDPGEVTRLTLFGRIDASVPSGTLLENEATVVGLDTDTDAANNVAACDTTVSAPTPGPLGSFVRLADESVAVPDGSGTFVDLGVPVLSVDLVAFSGTGSGTFETGTYGWRDGVLFAIVDSTLDLAGTPGECEFRDNTFPHDLSIDGAELVFHTFVEPESSCRSRSGIFHTTPCAIETLIDGRSHPAGVGGGFSGPSFSAGRVAFWASGPVPGTIELTTLANPGSSTAVVSSTTGIPDGTGTFDGLGPRPALDGARLVFWGGADVVGGHFTQSGLYLHDGTALSRLVDRSTTVPGQTVPLAGIGSLFALDGDQLLFTAAGAIGSGFGGLYRLDIPSGDIERVVDTATPIPGTGDLFTTFGAATLDSGRVLFVGGGASTPVGLYLWEGGPFTTVLAHDALLDGRDPVGLGLGREGMSGRRAVFQASFQVTSPPHFEEAIYLAHLPLSTLFADGFETGDSSRWSSTASKQETADRSLAVPRSVF